VINFTRFNYLTHRGLLSKDNRFQLALVVENTAKGSERADQVTLGDATKIVVQRCACAVRNKRLKNHAALALSLLALLRR
jgi:hypothetical protein